MAHATREHIRFAKSPLKLVVGQVRFPILPQYSDGTFVSPFIGALQSDYPDVSREQQLGLQISPMGVSANSPSLLWRLATRDNQWAVVLGESAVSLESRQYTTIMEFSERLEQVLQAIKQHLGVTNRMRVGLRYIDEIRYPGAETLEDWCKLLRPEFLGFAAFDMISGRVEEMLQQVPFQREDGVLVVRHGLLSGAAVTPLPPGPLPAGRFYLIDLDYFDNTSRELDIAEIMTRIRGYNEVMSQFFRSVLTPKLYADLEPTDDRAR